MPQIYDMGPMALLPAPPPFKVSSSALGHIQLRIQLIYGVLSLGVKRPGRELNHSSLSRNNDKIEWSSVSTPPYACIERLRVI